MIELERFTKDNRRVAMHDKSINRFAGNSDGSELDYPMPISEITYEVACRYNYVVWFSPKYKDEPIAAFEAILEFAKSVNISLKFDNVLQA